MKSSRTPHGRPKKGVAAPRFARPGGEEGSTLLEFAMGALVLFTFLVGIIYGGMMAYDNLVLANAVANGARTLGAAQGDPTVCADFQTAINNSAYGLNTGQLYIESPPTFTAVGGGSGLSSCDVTSGTSPTGATCSSSSPCQILYSGELATITATYPCSMNFPNLGINLCPVQGTVQKPSPNPNCPYSAYCISSTATVRIE